jgi:hypothetical protein
MNVLVAIRSIAFILAGRAVTVWCDNQAAVSILCSGRGSDPVLHSVAWNLWLLAANIDCDLQFSHISGADNKVADLLSRWDDHPAPTALLFQLFNDTPVWVRCPEDVWSLSQDI